MTPDQKETADAYASIPMPVRLKVLHDLVEFSGTEREPLVRAGIMIAARRILMQGTRLAREKSRKS